MAPKVKLQGIVWDCTEPSRLAKFYADLLNWKAQDGQYDFSTVSAPEESIIISCQLDKDYTPPVWPGLRGDQMQMQHLDFIVDNLEAAVQYALSLGAKKPLTQYWQPGWGAEWVTLLDPAGHPFCLCQEERTHE